jgi:hypothetical protein
MQKFRVSFHITRESLVPIIAESNRRAHARTSYSTACSFFCSVYGKVKKLVFIHYSLFHLGRALLKEGCSEAGILVYLGTNLF